MVNFAFASTAGEQVGAPGFILWRDVLAVPKNLELEILRYTPDMLCARWRTYTWRFPVNAMKQGERSRKYLIHAAARLAMVRRGRAAWKAALALTKKNPTTTTARSCL